MTSKENRLILSLAHRPLSASLSSKLIDRSASIATQVLQELEATKDGHSVLHDCLNNNRCNSVIHSPEKNLPHPTIHVNLTGSSNILTPGKLHADWETAWSDGELRFSQFISKIGLQHFQRLPKPGETRLKGRLVDLNLSQFSGIVSRREKLLKELVWIAFDVFKNFLLYSMKPVKKAIVLCPFGDDEKELEGGKDELVDIIRSVFEKEWSVKEGPLNGIKVEIEIVSTSELE